MRNLQIIGMDEGLQLAGPQSHRVVSVTVLRIFHRDGQWNPLCEVCLVTQVKLFTCPCYVSDGSRNAAAVRFLVVVVRVNTCSLCLHGFK